jgi:hypothetical protein
MEPMRKVPTSITMDPELIGRMDQAADEMDRSRSYVARIAFEAFLASRSPPPGGGFVKVPSMLGPPATAAGRGLGLSYPLEAPPGSTSHTQENSLMTINPHQKMMDEDVERVRRLQDQHGAAQVSNQDRQNRADKSPHPQVNDPRPGEPR